MAQISINVEDYELEAQKLKKITNVANTFLDPKISYSQQVFFDKAKLTVDDGIITPNLKNFDYSEF